MQTKPNEHYITLLESAKPLFHKYEMETELVDRYLGEMRDFKVITPLVGGFSSGKSSLVNQLLGQRLLKTQIRPETAIPAEITYGPVDRVKAYAPEGESELSIADLKTIDFNVATTELVRIRLNNEFLKEIDQVILVDMPGLDSGIRAHNRAIDDYLPTSLAYIVTVDSETGLRDSIIQFLRELKLHDNKPVFIAVTKTDKKAPHDLPDFERDILEKAQGILGIENVVIGLTSAKERKLDSLQTFLRQNQAKSHEIFVRNYRHQVLEELQQMEKYLSGRLEKKDFSLEDLAEQEAEVKQKFEMLNHRLDEQEKRFDEQVSECKLRIHEDVIGQLHDAADSFVRDLLNNRDIGPQVNQIVRRVITEGIKSQFEPKLQRFFSDVGQVIDINVGSVGAIQIDKVKASMQSMMKDLAVGSIPLIIAKFGARFAGPLGMIVGGVLTMLVESIFAKQKQDERKQIAAQKVHEELIPGIVNDVKVAVNDTIDRYVDDVQGQLHESLLHEKENVEKTLQDIRKQKALKQDELEQTLQHLQADLQTVRGLIAQIQ